MERFLTGGTISSKEDSRTTLVAQQLKSDGYVSAGNYTLNCSGKSAIAFCHKSYQVYEACSEAGGDVWIKCKAPLKKKDNIQQKVQEILANSPDQHKNRQADPMPVQNQKSRYIFLALGGSERKDSFNHILIERSFPQESESLVREAKVAGFIILPEDKFIFSKSKEPGKVEIFKCSKTYPDGKIDYFTSLQSNCEGQHKRGSLGFIDKYRGQKKGQSILVRCFSKSNRDHITTSFPHLCRAGGGGGDKFTRKIVKQYRGIKAHTDGKGYRIDKILGHVTRQK